VLEFLIISALNGVIYGMLLFMVSAGLTLIFGMMGVVNFAHASFYMLGAYFGYAVTMAGGFWAGLITAPLMVAIIGVAIERALLRPVAHHGHAHQILVTFGTAFIIRELVKMFFGRFSVPYQIPPQLRFAAFTLFGTEYPFYRVLMGVVALAMFALLSGLLRWTRVGIVVRAAVHKPAMAEALGHNVPLVFTMVFAIGAWLAGVAGAMGGAFFTTNPNLGLDLGVIVFVVVVVGGLGSIRGAFLASMIIGLISSFAVGFDTSLADLLAVVGLRGWAEALGGLMVLKVSSIAASVPIIIMLVVLLLRPAGLMGERQ
jgi:branched-chain amino acid transport system permease protein